MCIHYIYISYIHYIYTYIINTLYIYRTYIIEVYWQINVIQFLCDNIYAHKIMINNNNALYVIYKKVIRVSPYQCLLNIRFHIQT